jgi:hypothetical protein
MASVRRNITLTSANYAWLQEMAPNERALSDLINSLVQGERTHQGMEQRLVRHIAHIEAVQTRLEQAALKLSHDNPDGVAGTIGSAMKEVSK